MMTIRSRSRRFKVDELSYEICHDTACPGHKYNSIHLICIVARIFITGSADGLGRMAASLLVGEGHEVTLHARNKQRAKDAMAAVRGAKNVLIADLSSIDETKELARQVNELGRFDALIHNAGVYNVSQQLIVNVNTLAPYILTCLVTKPARLIYLSSGDHLHGTPNLDNLANKTGRISYADSKLHDVMLAMAVSRKYPLIYSNSVDPGWVATKMGGPGAPDDLEQGYQTQAWLAVSDDPKALVTGRHFYHKKEARHRPEGSDVKLQEKLLRVCEGLTGVPFQ
jgi:NAD(P)-dependent dehydrogenase (short-subunit alcohol dehydrogenase family)